MRSFFITGTDTDAGKTVATAALCALMRHQGIQAMPVKPVQTGCPSSGGTLRVPDLEFILAACAIAPPPADTKRLCMYRYEPACSPHLAAETAGKRIDPARIVRSVNALKQEYECLLVEGAGGIMVPLTRNYYMLDCMKDLALPVILVSRPGLGTLNHTLLSLDVLARNGLTLAGIVFCETRKPAHDVIEKDNCRVIAGLGMAPVLGTVPWFPRFNPDGMNPKLFLKAVLKSMPDAVSHLQERLK